MSTCIDRFLNYFGRWSERDAVLQSVRNLLEKQASNVKGQTAAIGVSRAEYLSLSQRGELLLQAGRAAQAERVFRDLLGKLGQAPSYERAVTLARLGRCLEAQGQPGAAEMYRQELGVLAQLEQSKDVKRQTGIAHTDLADVLTDAGQYGEARKEYEAGLQEARGSGDERSIGVILGQLGTLALKQNDLTEARRRYLEVLAIRQRTGELQGQAIYWHQLGRVAQEAKDWAEAERCYKESLALEERLGHAEGAAQTCNQLAIVAEGAGRPDEAERWYKRAIELNTDIDKRDESNKNYRES